jgi:hypothetical protein
MNCCLWLNGIKVWRAEDIYNNFDPASLRGYFLGGSLMRWLKANCGEKEALILEKTKCVYEAFGFDKPVEPSYTPVAKDEKHHVTASGSYNFVSSGSGFGSGSGSGFGSSSGSLGYGLHII